MEKVRQIKWTIWIVVPFLLCIAGAGMLHAQLVEEPEFRVLTREDGSVYVYHSTTLPLGYGYNLYRSRPGEPDRRLLNSEPVTPVSSEAALREQLGPLYWDLRTTLTSATDGREILYELRNDRAAGMLTAFLHRKVAEALGRLWTDEAAPGETGAVYTLEVLDEFGDPVGIDFTHQTGLTPYKPQAPLNIQAEHEGRYITLRWNYPAGGSPEEDHALFFNVFEELENGSTRKINPEIILRNMDEEEYEYEFSVNRTGQTHTFYVVAVDISGQSGDPGEPATIEVTDNVRPAFVNGVEGFTEDDGAAVITWPIATETRAAGYHIYRAESIEEEAPLDRLTAKPLPVDQTSYVDSLAGQSGASELWFYRVTVVSRAGMESEPSNAAMVQLPVFDSPPSAETFEAEVLEDGSVELTWEEPGMPDNFAGWVVLRRENRPGVPEDAAVQITPDSLFANRFVDRGHIERGLNEGLIYEYQLIAYSEGRFAGEPLTAEVSIPKTTPPDAPRNLSTLNEKGFRVQVNWNPVSDPFVERYRIYRKTPESDSELLAELRAPELSWQDELVEAGQAYIYNVVAIDEFGNISDPSAPDTVFVRAAGIPRTVRNVRAREIEEGGVHIWWEPVPGNNLEGYRVFRSDIATGVYEEIHSGLIENTRFTDPQGSRGMWYRVRAYDTSTNESRPSEAAQARGGQ